MKKTNPLHKLESQITSLGSSLEKVNMLLDQKSPTVSEAKRALKVCCVIYCAIHVVIDNCIYNGTEVRGGVFEIVTVLVMTCL